MCWIFAGRSLRYLTVTIQSILYLRQQHHASAFPRSLLMAPTFSAFVACTSGVAWWTVWKGKSSAKTWAIGDS